LTNLYNAPPPWLNLVRPAAQGKAAEPAEVG
jgi:hypothetical protein